MRTVESQITSVYPSQTNFVVEASFTWDHDITFERNGETITLKAGQYLQVGRQSFRPGGTKDHGTDIVRQLPRRDRRVQMCDDRNVRRGVVKRRLLVIV